jgi:hypothetical protein
MPDQKISAFTALTTPASADEIPIVDVDVVETKKITVSNLIYTWISDVDAGGNNFINVGYETFDRIADPGNPGTDEGRLYVKQEDANNDSLYLRIKKAGSFVEVKVA